MYIPDLPISPISANQGWQCPICRTVNAPWSPTCLGCPRTITSPQCTLDITVKGPQGTGVAGTPNPPIRAGTTVVSAHDPQLSLFNDLTEE